MACLGAAREAELVMIGADLMASTVVAGRRAPHYVRTRTTDRRAAWPITTQSKAFSLGYQIKSGSVSNGNNKNPNCQNCHDCQNRGNFEIETLKRGGTEE